MEFMVICITMDMDIHTPFGDYASSASVVLPLGHDTQMYDTQHYQYPFLYFQPKPVSNGTYSSNSAPTFELEVNSTSIAEPAPVSVDVEKSNSNGVDNVSISGNCVPQSLNKIDKIQFLLRMALVVEVIYSAITPLLCTRIQDSILMKCGRPFHDLMDLHFSIAFSVCFFPAIEKLLSMSSSFDAFFLHQALLQTLSYNRPSSGAFFAVDLFRSFSCSRPPPKLFLLQTSSKTPCRSLFPASVLPKFFPASSPPPESFLQQILRSFFCSRPFSRAFSYIRPLQSFSCNRPPPEFFLQHSPSEPFFCSKAYLRSLSFFFCRSYPATFPVGGLYPANLFATLPVEVFRLLIDTAETAVKDSHSQLNTLGVDYQVPDENFKFYLTNNLPRSLFGIFKTKLNMVFNHVST